MNNSSGVYRAARVAVGVACISLILGCATQSLDFSKIKTSDPSKQSNLVHFKESGHSVYMLLDLIEVSPITVEQLLARANPENRPVINLTVTSEAGGWATLLNILNGGIPDRGIIVSLNTVTVEGDLVQP